MHSSHHQPNCKSRGHPSVVARDHREAKRNPAWLRRASDYLDEWLDSRSLTLAGAAAASGLPPLKFAGLFKAAFGETFNQHVQRRRRILGA